MANYEVVIQKGNKKKTISIVAPSITDAEKQLQKQNIQVVSIDRKVWLETY